MTALNQLKAGGRQLACARCGTEFTCNVGGPCWCSEESVRLPLPQPGVASPTGFDDCLCRECLHAVAAEHVDSRR